MRFQPLLTFILFSLLLFLTCQDCLHNQFYDASSSQCLNCQNGCDQCSNSSANCTSCIANYYLADSSCLSCPKECYSCSSMTNCTACSENFYLRNYNCLRCPNNCSICSGSSCSVCQTGYAIETKCSSCAKQFYFNSSTNSCDMCVLGCLACTNKSYCSACDIRYNLINNGCEYLGNSNLTGTNSTNGDSRADGGSPTETSNKNIFFIILGVIVGAAVVSIASCCIYTLCTRKHKKTSHTASLPKLLNKVSNDVLNIDKESTIDHQNTKCVICKLARSQIQSSCGHFFHRNCYEGQQRKCPICPDEVSVAETYFYESNNKIQERQCQQSANQDQDQQVGANKKKHPMIEMDSLQ